MKDPVEVATQKTVPEVSQYQPTELRLYGVSIHDLIAKYPDDTQIKISMNVLTTGDQKLELALIYGYSYEGHCYSLPKPCLILVDSATKSDADGCGYSGGYKYDATTVSHYYMWTADKLDRTLELSVRQGFFEEIILDQNLGGSKPPAAYGTRVQLAHRGGKLTE